MNHLPLQHLEVKVGCLGAIFIYLVLQVGERHGYQITLGYGQYRGGLHLFCGDGSGREKVALCGYRNSGLVLPCHQGPALLNTKPPGPCNGIAWPPQLPANPTPVLKTFHGNFMEAEGDGEALGQVAPDPPLPLPGHPRGCVNAAVLQLDEERGHQMADRWLGGEEMKDSGVGVDVVRREVRQDGDAYKRVEWSSTGSQGKFTLSLEGFFISFCIFRRVFNLFLGGGNRAISARL